MRAASMRAAGGQPDGGGGADDASERGHGASERVTVPLEVEAPLLQRAAARAELLWPSGAALLPAPWWQTQTWPRTAAAGGVFAVAMLICGAVVTGLSLSGAIPALGTDGSPGRRTLVLNWTVTSSPVAPAGGALSARDALLVNGAWPGPTVDVTEGDRIVLHLVDAQAAPLSVHWHGVAQRGTPRADGAAHASTPPLPAGGTTTVEFTAAPAGTHFWHGHAGLNAAAGLYGALIVREPPGSAPALPPYDAEATLLLSDWWTAPLATLREGLLRRGAAFQWVGDPDALLVNGACASCGGGASVALPKGDTLRLRLVNAAALSCLSIAADGHALLVVQADGAAVSPMNAHEIIINAGERLSVLLTPSAAARAAGVVWLALSIRHRPHGPFGAVALRLPPPAGDASAFSTSASPAPMGPLPSQSAWNDTVATVAFYRSLAAPAGAPPLPPAPARPPLLLRGSQARVGGLMRWTVNDVAFVYPGDPMATTLASAPAAAAAPAPAVHVAALAASSDGFASSGATMLDVAAAAAAGSAPARLQTLHWESVAAEADNSIHGGGAAHMGTSVVSVPLGATLDIVLLNGAALNGVDEQHPWHMHGGAFWVLGLGEGAWPPTRGGAAPQPAAAPPLRDTITLPPGGWTWIRVRADNAGVWPLHCHITWHLFMGMQLVLVVGAPT